MRESLVLLAVGLPLAVGFHPSSTEASRLRTCVTSAPNPVATVRRTLSLGFNSAIADVLWLNAIQYYGSKENEAVKFSCLWEILDAVTDFDPRFEYAYQFAGEGIPYNDVTDGKWHNTLAAIEILKKGVAIQPHRWEIPWLLGYTLYTYWGRYEEAGAAMAIAADLAALPKRRDALFEPPTYLRSLATRLLAQGGDLQLAIDMTETALAQATGDREKADLAARLQALTLEGELLNLRATAKTLADEGHPPRTIEAVFDRSVQPPREDPYGAPFVLDSAGTVHSRNEDKLLRLQVHPGQPAVERTFD